MISNHAPLENRLRLAIDVLCYSIIKTSKLHYTDEGAQMFLRSMCKGEKESQLVLVAGNYPVICAHCGKQTGTNSAYATIARPRFATDCCFARSQDAVLARINRFTAFDFMPVVPMISTFMDIPPHIVQHYATLETVAYFAQQQKAINDLSRYSDAKTARAGFDIVTSLS